MTCTFCKKETGANQNCPDCGLVRYTAKATIVYGASIKDSSKCSVSITDKYLIIGRITGGSKAAAGFGLLGVLVKEIADEMKNNGYGYYPLSFIEKGIFPYLATGIKKKNAIKLINKNGSDFVLIFDEAGFVDSRTKVLTKMIENIRASIPCVLDGTTQPVSPAICSKPFVTAENFDKITPEVHNIATWSNQESNGFEQSAPTPVITPAPIKESVTPIEKSPIDDFSQSDTIKETIHTIHDISENQTERICCSCGTTIREGGIFCSNCGQKYEPPKPKKKFCARCGNELLPEDKFCFKCGTKA